MERFITNRLVAWKKNPSRKPLILRGARQVGKTWSIIDFGKKYFKGHIHIIDFEKNPDLNVIFESNLDAERIISEIELFLGLRIQFGKDLLFFDEIQNCPKAIMSLRYFYEQIPQMHIIAAGSLLDFAMKDISVPVGRIQFIDMHPLSFVEYLKANNKDKMAEILLDKPIKTTDSVHTMLLNELKNYFFVGGMPECVKIFSETKRLIDVLEIQKQLIDTYRQDFSKYAPYADKRCINSVLTSVAKSVGNQIIYTKLSDGFTSSTNKKAFDLLCLARLVHPIYVSSPAGLPLGASVSSKRFKALFLDIGLMSNICGINFTEIKSKNNLLSLFKGAMAEQFVGQELLAAGNELNYWSREAKSSTAEVDFLISRDSNIFPIEVKSGVAGRLKSLHLLLEKFSNVENGYVLSEINYSELPEQKLKFIPLYFAFNFSKYE